MSGQTVTDKRIRNEINKLDRTLCKLYEDYFGELPVDKEVWDELGRAEAVLQEKLKPRPLGLMAIRQACSAYTVAFRRACEAGRQRAGSTSQAHG